jgi:hypothetical protein
MRLLISGILFLITISPVFRESEKPHYRRVPYSAVLPQMPNSLTEEEKKSGWKLLFDGSTFNGWTGLGRDHIPAVSWEAGNGVIHKVNTGNLKQTSDGVTVEGGDIVTTETFLDFELVFEWKILKAGNSGLKYNLYRQQDSEGKPSVSALGFEYQMLDDGDNSYRNLMPSQFTGSLYEMIAANHIVLKPLGEFNSSRLVVKGNHVEHWLNGVKVLEYEFGSPELEAGYGKSKFSKYPGFVEKRESGIVLQNHTEEAWFRNIKIRQF